MDIQSLTPFFMWCTIINGIVLVLWAIMHMFAPTMVYRTQNAFFPMPRETFNTIFYSFLGFFKILFMVFNLVPYLALVILGSK